ncbi:trifunctional histidinol dehydrogenase [Agyrium rufum]|nr:trifunctional histidinol dehydrogenase [Agyrium rufum]
MASTCCFLTAIDLEDRSGKAKGGIDIRTALFLKNLYLRTNPGLLEETIAFVREHCPVCLIHVNATSIDDVDSIIALLDAGSAKVFISFEQLNLLLGTKSLSDLSRLVVSVDVFKQLQHVDEVTGLGGFHVQIAADSDVPSKISTPESDESGSQITYVSSRSRMSLETLRVLKERGSIPIIPASDLILETHTPSNHIPLQELVKTYLQTDRPDQLYPTIVTNERGIALGLVYSSEDSIREALLRGRGVYKSRKREGLWVKGETSGDYQELVSIDWDCDGDALRFTVRQRGDGFCHRKTSTCFGPYTGLAKLETTLQARKQLAPVGSYTARLFEDSKLLQAKIMEEAGELCEARKEADICAEAADLLYFAMTRCIAAGVSLASIEGDLDRKSLKISRRPGNAKSKWANHVGMERRTADDNTKVNGHKEELVKEAASVPKDRSDKAGILDQQIRMRRYDTASLDHKVIREVLQRPSQRSTDDIMNIVKPIISEVRIGGDSAVLRYTHKFDKATSLSSPVIRAPYPKELMQLSPETKSAIDISYNNIRCFHDAQRETKPLEVETLPGVVCSRFSKPIERVGLYIPGGTAVLPSTALMLGVPAMVAGCKEIVFASPPRADGSITSEIVYIAHKVGAESIVLAGGAQAVAAMAYGTESITKVDKILGPGNQFVTAAKMLVSNDTTAGVSIDMPAGPSEVLVVADASANPAFVASDLLSQAEHGVDSQVILIGVGLDEGHLEAIELELHAQAIALPRVDIVRGAIEHSVTLMVKDINEAMKWSNWYAPEHLILQVDNAEAVLGMVEHAGSVFVGEWTPESVGDYSAGVNHSLPTYGYAKQYSGVNLSSFTKHITSSRLTAEGLRNVSTSVMQLAKVEELEAHRRAVSIRLEHMSRSTQAAA